VRGKGLLIGVVLEAGYDAAEVTATALGQGLVINAPAPGILRLAPPLTVSVAEVDEAVSLLGSVLGSLRAPAGEPAER
jgi:acetylornithine aminotransferase